MVTLRSLPWLLYALFHGYATPTLSDGSKAVRSITDALSQLMFAVLSLEKVQAAPFEKMKVTEFDIARPLKNGCSFEDDLSLGAEAQTGLPYHTLPNHWPTLPYFTQPLDFSTLYPTILFLSTLYSVLGLPESVWVMLECVNVYANHLQNNSTKPSDPGYSMPAKEKRSQFKQKGRSMNSTGSGKSSGTVSSVSELLDLYEEDPEEILYNLGFGREEPDIASKIPSRFFNSPSSAKGIDIKVYLGAQMQRMELDNPNYALTSRFRQTEVLATVANVFSEIYSQVSGRPLQRIGTKETEPKEPPLLRSNSSALNAAKILKKSLTRPNLLNATEGGHSQPGATSDPVGVERGSLRDLHSDSEPKPQKVFWKKDSSPHLATVTEETLQGAVSAVEGKSALTDKALAGEPPPILAAPVVVNVTDVSEKSGDAPASESAVSEDKEGQKTVPSSTLDRDTCSLFPNPHMNHLRTEPRDSFEMEEVLHQWSQDALVKDLRMTNTNCAAADELSSLTLHLQGGLTSCRVTMMRLFLGLTVSPELAVLLRDGLRCRTRRSLIREAAKRPMVTLDEMQRATAQQTWKKTCSCV
ncbi:hypothetical protein SRHO_G00105000 [Serrasalmus rhombeus]